MTRPLRRFILKVFLLLFVGATLNVAVAWGLKVWSPVSNRQPDLEAGEFHNRAMMHYDQHTSVENRREVFVTTAYSRGVGHRVDATTCSSSQYWRHKCGWPMYSVIAECLDERLPRNVFEAFNANRGFAYDRQSGALFLIPQRTILPSRPLWPGFAINTLFYAGVLWMLFAGPFAMRRMIRRRRGQCVRCAYPIGTNQVCTECGESLQPRSNASRSDRRLSHSVE